MRASLLCLGLFICCACGEAPEEPPRTLEERLSGPGVHAVGYLKEEISYLPPEGAAERVLPVSIWYPTDTPSPSRVTYSFRQSQDVSPDAEPAAGPWPVLIFSHGHLAYGDVNSHLTEHFASHGWLVLAPDHTGNTFRDNPGGDRVTSDFYLRPRDLTEVLNHYERLDSEHPLAGRFGDIVVATGHSFGGYTTYAFAGATYDVDGLIAGCEDGTARDDYCSELTPEAIEVMRSGLGDPRVDLAIPMASGNSDLFGDDGLGNIEIPVLHMVAEGDGNPAGGASEDDIWTRLEGDQHLRMNFLRSGHNDFTDVCSSVIPLRCGMDVDPLEEQRKTRLYSFAFVRARLFDDVEAAALLEPDRALPNVEISLSR